jgi:hypothetical protein
MLSGEQRETECYARIAQNLLEGAAALFFVAAALAAFGLLIMNPSL